MNPQMARGDAESGGNGNGRSSTEHLLALRGFSKSFGPVRALHEVDFEVDAGEIVALVGDNGAGKSTLIKAIDGVQPPDSGEAYFEGQPVRISSPQSAERLGIATVFQDLALCDNLDVVANLFLGKEEVDGVPVHVLDEVEMEQRANQLLEDLSVTTLGSVRTEVGMLSGGQRQSVAIARTLIGEPKVVLFDEPTAALGVAQTAQVLALVKRLAEEKLGIVMISHNLEDVFQVADRIIVLRLGERVATFDREQTTPEQVVGAITGADTAEMRRLEEQSGERGGDPVEGGVAAQLKVFGREARSGILGRVLRGELGVLQVFIALALIWTIFQLANDRFLTSVNLTNLMLQVTAVGIISIGVVLVLLLGEIDLSIGAVSGLAAGVMAVLTVQHGWSPELAIVAGLLTGTAIGLFNGFMVTFFRIPSFVVTLAGLLAWQGALLQVLGETGTVNLPPSSITDLTSTFYGAGVGWTLAVLVTAGTLGLQLQGRR